MIVVDGTDLKASKLEELLRDRSRVDLLCEVCREDCQTSKRYEGMSHLWGNEMLTSAMSGTTFVDVTAPLQRLKVARKNP